MSWGTIVNGVELLGPAYEGGRRNPWLDEPAAAEPQLSPSAQQQPQEQDQESEGPPVPQAEEETADG